jgi:hypothetical protein
MGLVEDQRSFGAGSGISPSESHSHSHSHSHSYNQSLHLQQQQQQGQHDRLGLKSLNVQIVPQTDQQQHLDMQGLDTQARMQVPIEAMLQQQQNKIGHPSRPVPRQGTSDFREGEQQRCGGTFLARSRERRPRTKFTCATAV